MTGVAGSGKSSLIDGSVSGRDGVVAIDQGAIKGSRRSNPATYTGLLDPIRTAFAKANGVKPALFSANSEGACPTCNGAGVIYTELGFMETVSTTCEDCEGKRFDASVLEYHLGGRDISEVLAMSATEAEAFFGSGEAKTPAAHTILDRLVDVGLGYLRLGQPLPTLSGGERQRLKLATHMGAKGGVYVLDEPTSGLHLADVENLLGLLDRLVDSGKSVIVIEHHQAVMAHADWIIDLGPGAGHGGGRIVFEGTPADLVADRSTLTGEHLAAYVGRLTRGPPYAPNSSRQALEALDRDRRSGPRSPVVGRHPEPLRRARDALRGQRPEPVLRVAEGPRDPGRGVVVEERLGLGGQRARARRRPGPARRCASPCRSRGPGTPGRATSRCRPCGSRRRPGRGGPACRSAARPATRPGRAPSHPPTTRPGWSSGRRGSSARRPGWA